MNNPTYECDGCGACCRTKLVDVYEEDLLREPRLHGQMKELREPGIDGEVGYLIPPSEKTLPIRFREEPIRLGTGGVQRFSHVVLSDAPASLCSLRNGRTAVRPIPSGSVIAV